MKVKSYILLFLSCLEFFSLYSQNFGAIQFVENKGQWNKEVRFMAEVPAGAIFIHQDGFTVLQHNPLDWAQLTQLIHGHDNNLISANQKITIHSHAYRVHFLNAAHVPEVVADKPLYTYNNYFIGNDPSKWAANCKIYQGLTFQNIYPNVDVRYYTNNGQIKYDLIVKPGADVAKIALKYDGADKLEVKDKELVVKTSVGDLKELAPYSYQYTERGKKTITAKYLVKGNVVKFDVKDYNSAQTLIIDPTLVFCSFSGSIADNWGFTATYGPDGSMYGGGIVSGIVSGPGFPVSPGAYQTAHKGGQW
ncbi:MAG: hypothetical protein ICV66_07760, partial [Chitinophagaceae bacterium]|nr:hypothetical protein [Chitinophagaceae bacterium]